MNSLFEDILSRHQRVALSFGGGRDSLALLHLASPYLDHMTVYWCNPGNPFPETVEIMREVEASVPHFKEVAGYQKEMIETAGWPSDVVPHRYTCDGNKLFGETPFRLQFRTDCCFRSMMMPLYQAMMADGVTCIIRGKRRDEKDRTGIESGYVSRDGIELQFPLIDWSEADVMRYLAENNIPLPSFYKHARHSLDCMDCTAWWGDGLGEFLAHEHPEAFAVWHERMTKIKSAVNEQMAECEV